MAGYLWPRSTSSRSINTQNKELGRYPLYPVILTSRLINSPCTLKCFLYMIRTKQLEREVYVRVGGVKLTCTWSEMLWMAVTQHAMSYYSVVFVGTCYFDYISLFNNILIFPARLENRRHLLCWNEGFRPRFCAMHFNNNSSNARRWWVRKCP